MDSSGLIRVGAEHLESVAEQLRVAHGAMSEGFESLSAELLRTMVDWGEGTASREAYDGFKVRVDRTFADMLAAVQAMPPLVTQAAQDARAGETRRAGMWGG